MNIKSGFHTDFQGPELRHSSPVTWFVGDLCSVSRRFLMGILYLAWVSKFVFQELITG